MPSRIAPLECGGSTPLSFFSEPADADDFEAIPVARTPKERKRRRAAALQRGVCGSAALRAPPIFSEVSKSVSEDPPRGRSWRNPRRLNLNLQTLAPRLGSQRRLKTWQAGVFNFDSDRAVTAIKLDPPTKLGQTEMAPGGHQSFPEPARGIS